METQPNRRVEGGARCSLLNHYSRDIARESNPCECDAWNPAGWPNGAHGEKFEQIETDFEPNLQEKCNAGHECVCTPITTAEFIESRFVPEFIALKHPAGRTYFQAMLKHVLPPEIVNRAFAATPADKKKTLKAVRGWPYIHLLQLSDITPQVIRNLTAAALASGYSIQTATHIRNVVRSVIAHAIRAGFYHGSNPAFAVSLPPLTCKEMPNLSIEQLVRVFKAMRYPEREVAMFTVLTDMNIAEICGLHWKFTNLSSAGCFVDHESVPAKSLAIRTQNFRGELVGVLGKRRRFVRLPDLLESALKMLKKRERFTSPDDFVLVSRNGSPLRPENIAARRLKAIGRTLEMPWLTWSTFKRTRVILQTEIGRNFQRELASLLTTGPANTEAGRSRVTINTRPQDACKGDIP